jgi:uncharacterized protein (TIGR02145 family)
MKLLSLTVFLYILPYCFLAKGSENSITSHHFETVKIGTQEWTAYNLNIKEDGSWCENCQKHGRFYTWEAARKIDKKIKGWHIPSDEEWRELEKQLGSPEHEEEEPYRKGANQLKKNKEFHLTFPGRLMNNKVIAKNKKVSYWTSTAKEGQVTLTDGTQSNEKLVFARTISKKGSNNSKIYVHATIPSSRVGFSLRLIKD